MSRIESVGTYVPRYRLSAETVRKAWGQFHGAGITETAQSLLEAQMALLGGVETFVSTDLLPTISGEATELLAQAWAGSLAEFGFLAFPVAIGVGIVTLYIVDWGIRTAEGILL